MKRFEAQPFCVGIDVHKQSYRVALRRTDGKTVTLVCPANPQGLVRLIHRLSIPMVAVGNEAGPTGFGLVRTLRVTGIEILMAAPSRISRAVTSGAKTDRRDCLWLADYAAEGLIRSIAVPPPPARGTMESAEALTALPLDPHARLTLESHLRELTLYKDELSKVEEEL